jgi:hypothetical protein
MSKRTGPRKAVYILLWIAALLLAVVIFGWQFGGYFNDNGRPSLFARLVFFTFVGLCILDVILYRSESRKADSAAE